MSDKKEQVKPLAPASHRVNVDYNSDYPPDPFRIELDSLICHRRQRCIKLCGCSAAVLLITVTVILVLMFTVFHLKDPVLTVNAVNVLGLDGLNTSTGLGPSREPTFDFNVTVKNPNAAPFKFGNTTTYVYYDGLTIGEETGRAGEAGARKRLQLNVSVGVSVEKINRVGRLKRDFDAGMLSVRSYTRINGRVKITTAIKRGFVVKINCTMNVIIRRQEIQDLNCS